MPLSAPQRRERRAAQRAAEAQDATRGEPRPSGRAPVGYYWDPRPGEPTGTWRNLLTNEALDLGAAKRDTKYAAELLGLRLDVPWSVWHGYEAGGREPGILWRYDAEERTFTVRFENELDLDDLEDVSWAEVLGTVPMAESAGEPAILHRLDELPLVRAPRGTQPQDGAHYTSPAFASRPSPRPPRARPRLRMCPHALSKPPCARRCPREEGREGRFVVN